MSDVIISKINEVYVKIQTEKHILREMSEYFTFLVPGHQFTPAFRNRIWDGKIRLLDLRNNQIYHGLLTYIEEFLKDRGYTYEYDETRADLEDECSVYHAKKFIDSLNLHANGKPITVNDHQMDAYIEAMQKRRRLLLSPTASGKSLIIYLIFRQLYQYKDMKGLIIVPTTSLVEQLFSDFGDYANGSLEEYIHRVYQGKDKDTNKPLTISTWQSLYKLPTEYFHQFDYIIGDEAHLFKAQSLATIMTSCINAKYRIGLTGTLDGTKTHKLVLEGLFGAVKKVITTKELMEQGKVSQFEIKCLVLKHPADICEQMVDADYQTEISYLIENEQRNKFIKNLALSMNKNTMVLYQMVDRHGKMLYNMIKDSEKIGERKVFFVHGGTDTADREEIRRIMEFCKEDTIFLDFDDYEIILDPNEPIDLVNKLQKKARDITENDDIDTSILINKIQTSILKGYVWKKKNGKILFGEHIC